MSLTESIMEKKEPTIEERECSRCHTLRPTKRVKKREWKGEIVHICVYCIRREIHLSSDLVRIKCKPKCLKCGKKAERSFLQCRNDLKEVKFFYCSPCRASNSLLGEFRNEEH